MSVAKLYSTYLEGPNPDGSRWSCELKLTLTGFSNTNPVLFATQVENSLGSICQTILEDEELDFSRSNLADALEHLWRP